MTTLNAELDLPSTRRSYEWATMLPFVLVHVGALGALGSDVSAACWICCGVLYVVRMFGVTAGYHRYFAHRAFKTSRVGQFLLALLAETSSQKGVLWWAAHHRTHHKHSDTAQDLHSPVRDGFWYAHLGWIYNHTSDTDFDRVRDLAKYPELRWLNRFWQVPPLLLAAACFIGLGWSGFCVGFCLSTVLLWHATFAINSLAHLWGTRRYATEDQSRNNLPLALLTLGEGWHNNHHHHMHSARQGFFPGEIDISYGVLRLLHRLGLVWDLREPPLRVLSPPALVAAAPIPNQGHSAR